MAENARQILLSFLEQRAFDPVLEATSERYSESDQRVLEQLQRKTDFQKHRYRIYSTAGEIRRQFEDDLQSQAVRKAHASLQRLGLPSLPPLRDEFLKLADAAGARRSAPATHPYQHQPPSPLNQAARQPVQGEAGRRRRRVARKQALRKSA